MMEDRLPAPEEVRATFRRLFDDDPEKAVAYLYALGTASGYLKSETVERALRWTSESAYGTLECTINLAKPEKDPRTIAKAASNSSGNTGSKRVQTDAITAFPESHPARVAPLCDLCWENEGFPGTCDHPAKPGLRIAPLSLGGECWGLQFSPYAYFPEHCIALSREHRPMKIDVACFERLLDFVDALPFYFVGSNADLPIVGGSILSHDHFQGGRYTFPLMKAPVEREVALSGAPGVRAGIVRWPASVLRLRSENRSELAHAATNVLYAWQGFSCDACNIVSASAGETGIVVTHNTLNPIVRKTGSTYSMDLVLRNNRIDAEHPWGIFHPGAELHHLKKENIGLIEIMGLAILPPRLATEIPAVQRELIEAARSGLSPEMLETRLRDQSLTASHASWAAAIYARRSAEFLKGHADLAQSGRHATSPSVPRKPGADLSAHAHAETRPLQAEAPEPDDVLHPVTSNETKPPEPVCALHPVIKDEIGRAFARILETTSVFKRDETGQAGWTAFLDELNRTR
ncbi:UDP-glucose--hexose-1-phosphate uridylyltransferase [Raoultibacter phocaeensis]|uniref:UDP-glucose--hexose-1-phosphate uridylyltransferase n=1 Tax=Raoultibacter phocaeensis TaxID=2479841 RepID=UPI00210821B9|nr:UDP-glucose--hexose-1-phosphate uridylyltransferase [Raoultibacter phocaeensis]